MRNLRAPALFVVAAAMLAAPASADDNNKKKEPPKNVTWAMLKTADVKLMLFADREHIAKDGMATVVIATGAPTDKTKAVAIDVELLLLKDKDNRKVVSSWRQSIDLDSNTHEIQVPVTARGAKLDGYSVLVRAIEDKDKDTRPDAVDSTISLTQNSEHRVILGLGK